MAHVDQEHAVVKKGRGGLSSAYAIAILTALILAAPFQAGSAAEKTTDQLLKEARAAVKSMSINEVREVAEGRERAVLLDIRDRKAFMVDHIKGARNMSRAVGLSPRILEHHMKKIVPDKLSKIVVYCELETKSPLAVKAMNEIGYANAAYMRGGLTAWKEAGYSLEK